MRRGEQRGRNLSKLPVEERVDPDDIRTELERVLSSSTFARSERARGMLRYIVEQDLDGKGDLLKGFTIAQDVFGKSDDFDPAMDAVVRVQAGRLRDQLSGYYEAEGANNPVQIKIPRGTYVPVYTLKADNPKPDDLDALDFDGNGGQYQPLSATTGPIRIEPDVPVSPFIVANFRRFWFVLISIVILLLVILFVLWRLTSMPSS